MNIVIEQNGIKIRNCGIARRIATVSKRTISWHLGCIIVIKDNCKEDIEDQTS